MGTIKRQVLWGKKANLRFLTNSRKKKARSITAPKGQIKPQNQRPKRIVKSDMATNVMITEKEPWENTPAII
jgi:hypothetical protein